MQVIKFRSQTGEITGPIAVAVEERADAEFVENSVLVPQRIGLRTIFRMTIGGHVWNSEALFDAQNVRRLDGRIESHVVSLGPHILRAGQQIGDSITSARCDTNDLGRHESRAKMRV